MSSQMNKMKFSGATMKMPSNSKINSNLTKLNRIIKDYQTETQ